MWRLLQTHQNSRVRVTPNTDPAASGDGCSNPPGCKITGGKEEEVLRTDMKCKVRMKNCLLNLVVERTLSTLERRVPVVDCGSGWNGVRGGVSG